MMPRYRSVLDHDDTESKLARLVESAVVGALAAASLEHLTFIRVDGFFGPKWHRFAGKLMGALGVARLDDELAPPPFVPARVLRQESFTARDRRLGASTSVLPTLHVELLSEVNTRRRMATIAPHRVVCWLGGGRPVDDRASLMCHVVTNAAPMSWYVELLNDPKWRVAQPHGISRQEFDALIALGGSGRAAHGS
jgi:hypothetical protein